jgi:type III secretion protein L
MAIGKVIKGDAAPVESSPGESRPALRPPRPGVVNAEVFEAHQSAQSIVEAARRQAEEIIQVAEMEKTRVLDEAKAQGRQEGLAQVTEQIVRAKLLRTEFLQNAENDIVALACKVAEKIIGRDLERNPEVVVDICATAIENVRTAQQVVVRVNPQDAAILRERRKRMMELIGRVKEIAIKEDGEVPRYGCIIETDSGTLDAQLSTQLEMLRNVLVTDNAKKEGPA